LKQKNVVPFPLLSPEFKYFSICSLWTALLAVPSTDGYQRDGVYQLKPRERAALFRKRLVRKHQELFKSIIQLDSLSAVGRKQRGAHEKKPEAGCSANGSVH
jgi:hypothetical protein